MVPVTLGMATANAAAAAIVSRASVYDVAASSTNVSRRSG